MSPTIDHHRQQLDPYEVLQVHPQASHEVVAAAYRALARRFHPDVSQDPGALQQMIRLNEAWELVGDPERRAAHDRARAVGTSSAPPPPAAPAAEPAPRPAAAPEPTAGTYVPGGRPDAAAEPAWTGAAGPPRGLPWGSVLDFGLYRGWSLGQVARHDPGYLLWLEERHEARHLRDELDQLLRRIGMRRDTADRPARSPLLNTWRTRSA